MASILENVIIRLNELGFFAFLPFLLTSAIIYGLLRRSKIFGEPEKNVSVNATVAIVAAFMVWGYPIISGTSVAEYQKIYSEFFFKGSIVSVFFLIGLLILTMFVPTSFIEAIKDDKIKKVVIALTIGIFGFISILTGSIFSSLVGISVPQIDLDLIYSVIFLVIFIGIIVGIVWLTGREEKKQKT